MSADVDYQHHGTGLLRAAAEITKPRRWPDPADEHDCRCWLGEVWSVPGLAGAIRHASPVLATRVEAVLAGAAMSVRDLKRATLAVVRYVLRASGRPTPFGTFAGVSTVSVGTSTQIRWGEHHRPIVRADTRWLYQVIERCEECPGLLALLDVTFNDSAELRGGRLETPGPNKVSIRSTGAVAMVRDEAESLVQFRVLADKLAHAFPSAGEPSVMLVSLVRPDSC